MSRLEYMHELLDHILNLQEWLAIGRGTAKIYDKRLLKNIRAWLYLYFSARDRYGQ